MNMIDTWLTKTPIAHRGLHDETSPENSMSAFEKAIKKGYAIEMDIQMTCDGVLLVFHDDWLNRMTKGEGDIRNKRYGEIKNLTLGSSDEKIPLFKDFLNSVNARTPILIEIKDHKNIGILESKIKAILDHYSGDFAIQSFNPFIIDWFKRNAPSYPRGQLSCFFHEVKMAAWKKYMLKKLFFINKNQAQFISYDMTSATKFKKLQKIKTRMPLLLWTIRSQETFDEVRNICDNIIFENFLPKT